MACVHLWQDCDNCVTLAVWPQRYPMECVKCGEMRTASDAWDRRRMLIEGVEANRGKVNGIELDIESEEIARMRVY